MERPIVSVVIPTRNRAGLLERAVSSVSCQTLRELEILVVDDASDVPAATALERLRDPRLRCLRMPRNVGQAAARNHGARSAKGTWLAFLDDDDEWLPGHLGSLLEHSRRHPSARVLYRPYLIAVGDRVALHEIPLPHGDVLADLAGGWAPAITSGLVVRADVFEPGYDETLVGIEDFDLWLSLASRTQFAADARPLVIVDKTPARDRTTMGAARRIAAIQRLQAKWSAEMSARGLHEAFEATCRQLTLVAQMTAGGETDGGHGRIKLIMEALGSSSIPRRTRYAGAVRTLVGPRGTAGLQRAWFALFGVPRASVTRVSEEA